MHIICAQKKDGIASVLVFLAIYCFHDSVDYFREIPATLGSVEKSEVLTVSYSCAVIPPTAWYAILLCGAEIVLYALNSCFCISLIYRAELTDYYRYSLAEEHFINIGKECCDRRINACILVCACGIESE